jgi:L-arabinose isomerase
MYLASALLDDKGFCAFTAQFDIFGDDKRFKQLPLYALASSCGTVRLRRGRRLRLRFHVPRRTCSAKAAQLYEMYMMDFEKDAICFCHAARQLATHRKDIAPRLIDRYLGEGGWITADHHVHAGSRPFHVDVLAPMSGERFKLVTAVGDILSRAI